MEWLNVAFLRMDRLLGRHAVLVEFWDFARVNSLRTQPYLKAFDTVDGTVTLHLRVAGADTDAFLNVSNIFNARAPLFPSNSGIPGLFYPTLGFHDDMGRYYTAGFRLRI